MDAAVLFRFYVWAPQTDEVHRPEPDEHANEHQRDKAHDAERQINLEVVHDRFLVPRTRSHHK